MVGSVRDARVVTVTLHGHLTEEQLRGATADAEAELSAAGGAPTGLIIDALAMKTYEHAARAAFVAWVRRHRPRLHGIAILTANTLWFMVISAMSLASGVRMKPFRSRSDAEAWLDGAPR